MESEQVGPSSDSPSYGFLKWWFFQTPIGKQFIRHQKQVLHFVAPMLSGLAAAFLLYLLDLCRGTANAEHSIAFEFCNGVISHFDPVLILLGAFLATVCNLLIGSAFVRGVQQLFVLPIIRLGHHIVLVGAGTLIALCVASCFSPDVSAQTTAFLGFGVFMLIVGGVELQFAETVAAMKESAIEKHMPLWAFIGINAAMVGVTGYYLLKQLAHGH